MREKEDIMNNTERLKAIENSLIEREGDLETFICNECDESLYYRELVDSLQRSLHKDWLAYKEEVKKLSRYKVYINEDFSWYDEFTGEEEFSQTRIFENEVTAINEEDARDLVAPIVDIELNNESWYNSDWKKRPLESYEHDKYKTVCMQYVQGYMCNTTYNMYIKKL